MVFFFLKRKSTVKKKKKFPGAERVRALLHSVRESRAHPSATELDLKLLSIAFQVPGGANENLKA